MFVAIPLWINCNATSELWLSILEDHPIILEFFLRKLFQQIVSAFCMPNKDRRSHVHITDICHINMSEIHVT